MKYLTILLISILCFLGCQEVKQPEKPQNLIPEDKMVDILTETYLANAARSVDNKAIVAQGIQMDDLIFRNFGVDSLQFVKSNNYYAANVNAYMRIFEKVEARLDVMQKNMDSLYERKRRQKDSVKTELKEDQENVKPVRDSLI